ncbi:MAG: transposase [Spirosomataceae bacterium]
MAYKRYKQYRLQGYDYARNGAYFITIVTKNREHWLGEITAGTLILSEIGKQVEANFSIIANKISHLQVEEWVIMPNHLHLIVTIENNKPDVEIRPDTDVPVGTRLEACSYRNHSDENDSHNNAYPGLRPLDKQSVSAFINHLKGQIKRWCNENGHSDFAWQARFHDRIIRDDREYFAIANYIQNNVANWENDSEK